MKYKIEFNYRYGKDYVYCNEYHEDERCHLILMVNPYVLLKRLI
nr:MAG TPA: hypothetical protein [Caudoviricetes sp.]